MTTGDFNILDILEVVEFLVNSFREATYICLASLVLLCYDYLLTIDDELESFWTGPWNWSRALFFLNRYLSIVFVFIELYGLVSASPSEKTHAQHRCQAVTACLLYGNLLAVTFSGAVLSMRIYALYKPYKLVTRILVVLFGLVCVSNLTLVVLLQLQLKFSLTLQTIVHGCPNSFMGNGFALWRIYIPTLVLQTFLSAMILYKAVRQPFHTEYAKSMMSFLVRDGTIVYLVILVTIIISIVGALVETLEIPLNVASPLLPVTSICTNRILFNLRAHIHQISQEHGYLSGMELTSLYLGGYRGGIAPARGVEGATVKEIGNTTVIDVPVQSIDYDVEGSEAHTAHSDRHGSMRLKVSAFGATPNWERWDNRVPTKDFKLPSVPPVSEQDRSIEDGSGGVVDQSNDRKRRNRRRTLTASQSTIVRSDTSTTQSRPGTSGTEPTLHRKNSYYASAGVMETRTMSPTSLAPKSSRQFTADEDLGRG